MCYVCLVCKYCIAIFGTFDLFTTGRTLLRLLMTVSREFVNISYYWLTILSSRFVGKLIEF